MISTDINTILSDPKFEIERFLYYVNIQEQHNLIKKIINDPTVLLSIADSPEYSILHRHVGHSFDATVFEKFHEMGLEVWFKKTEHSYVNHWYGVIISENLAIYYTDINGGKNLKVLKNEECSNIRETWKRLKLCKMSEVKENTFRKGSRFIDRVRKQLSELLKTKFVLRSNSDYTNGNLTFYFNHDFDRCYINLNVISRGNCVNCTWDNAFSETAIKIKNNDNVIKDPLDIANEIVNWMINLKISKDSTKHLSQDVLNQLKQRLIDKNV